LPSVPGFTKIEEMDSKTLLARLKKVLSREGNELDRLALAMHRNPEIAFREFKTSELLADFLKQRGFKMVQGLAGLQTSFRASSVIKKKKPAIGFLAELDGLPELGHACGHNLIAGASVTAAVVLRRAFPDLAGSIEVIGCPAEERGGGKVILNNAGVFDHLDLAVAVHPSNRTEIYKLSLALVAVSLEFKGRAAHAAAAPEKGINALDALIQTFNAVSIIRRRLGPYGRINGIITEGGKAPNIIPDRAAAEFWVRDDSLDQALSHAQMVRGVARSAAKVVGAGVKVRVDEKLAYAPFRPNRAAGEVFKSMYEQLGVKIDQGDEKKEMGSTDIGNLSWNVPALHPTVEICKDLPHTPAFAKAAGSARGLAMMHEAGLAMAALGYMVMTDAGLRRSMKEEHERGKSQP
jgi:amidohydrolase